MEQQTDSVCLLFQVNRKMVITIWFRFYLIRFWKNFYVCTCSEWVLLNVTFFMLPLEEKIMPCNGNGYLFVIIGLWWHFLWSCLGFKQSQKCNKKMSVCPILSFTLLEVAVTGLAHWNILHTLYNWFSRQFFEVFQNVLLFFINIFDISSPGCRCNWPSPMKFCVCLV